MDAPEDFGTGRAEITTADQRLEAWALICVGGATNLLLLHGVSWSWSTEPRRQKNGAVLGRVYMKRRGELARDVGHYKIAADGEVLEVPPALAGVLPGAERAAAAGPEGEEPVP